MKNTQQNPAGHTAEQSAGKLYSVILPQSNDSGRRRCGRRDSAAQSGTKAQA